jgi:hypothetical protein
MKKQLVAIATCITLAWGAAAQENHLNFGIGISGWGIPIYASYDFNVAKNLNVIVGASYQTKTESYSVPGYSYKWRNDILAFRGGVQYYFDELLNLDDKFDVYGIGVLSYYVWNQTYEGPGNAPVYTGSGDGGIGIGLGAGGRWHFSDKWSLNLELGGGNVMSGVLFGVSLAM